MPWNMAPVEGYEIHCGTCEGADLARPFAWLTEGRADGAVSTDGRVLGTYLHGLFDHTAAQQALLRWAGLADACPVDIDADREASLERLADMIDAHLDVTALVRTLGLEA